MPQRRDVVAAGAVVFRSRREVLLVHRPRYDDWSLPKGKLDRGELPAVAAVREVAEETGLHVRLGPPLTSQLYSAVAGWKTVHYWVGWPVGDHDVGSYRVNDEIDEVVWLPVAEALERLTYPHDRETVGEAVRERKKTHAVVVLRHGKARSRKGWTHPDRERPLVAAGRDEAQRLVALLAAYGVTRVVSSSSTRCVQTVQPYADSTGWELEEVDGLSEEGATVDSVLAVVDELVAGKAGAVLCSHRPVIPTMLDAVGVPDVALDPGACVVLHVRKGRVVCAEVHERP